MKRTLYLALVLLLLFPACRRDSAEKDKSEPQEAATTIPPLVIDASGVGEFRLGEKIPKQPQDAGLTVKKEIVSIEAEGEAYEEPWYIVRRGGMEVLRILPIYDPEEDAFSDRIGEIRVISPECFTSDSLHVGTTVEQLAANTSQLAFWYTYVSDRFVADTPLLPGLQFLLTADGFIGARDDLMDTDLVFLTRADFRPTTTVRMIRILGEE